ncbi:helix-turn-helix transcriptional regulator [Enterococcus sp. LJL128]
MQINRLLEIILILLYRKKTTAKEMAERFSVSVRTIYRDVDTLSVSGIPVYSVKGKNGGIFLEDSFTLDQALLGNEEKDDLFLALNLLKSLGILETDELMRKFESAFDLTDWLELTLPATLPHNNNTFSQLKKAILLVRKITFIFYSRYGQTMLITAEPLKIIFRSQSWFLLGYVPEKKEHQLFRIDCIKSITILDEYFHPKLPESIDNLFDKFKVTLQFSKRIAYNQYDRFFYDEVSVNPDNSYNITFEFTELDELYSFLLPFGRNVKIIEPLWVKEKICAHAKYFLENNL